MRSYRLESFDSPPRLGDAPRPPCGEREIVVRVLSSSVNPVDRMVAKGFFRHMQEYRLPAVIGRDVCGIVDEIGAQVGRYDVGDRVFGFVKRDYVGDGTFAEYVACADDWFVGPIPDSVSTRDAGVLGLSSITALACLDAVELTRADTVFINGATGGTGTFALQLARMRGARVIASARPGAKTELVRELGADHVIDWTADATESALRELVPDGVDAVVDLAPPTFGPGPGGPPGAGGRPGGGPPGGGPAARNQQFAAFVRAVGTPQCRVASLTNGVDPELLPGRRGVNVHSDPSPRAIATIAAAVADGSLRAVVSAEFDLDDVEAAFEHLDAHVPGKIALHIASHD